MPDAPPALHLIQHNPAQVVSVIGRSVLSRKHEIIFRSPLGLLSVGAKHVNQFTRDVQRPDGCFSLRRLQKLPPHGALNAQLPGGHNKSLGASGATVFRKIIGPAMRS